MIAEPGRIVSGSFQWGRRPKKEKGFLFLYIARGIYTMPYRPIQSIHPSIQSGLTDCATHSTYQLTLHGQPKNKIKRIYKELPDSPSVPAPFCPSIHPIYWSAPVRLSVHTGGVSKITPPHPAGISTTQHNITMPKRREEKRREKQMKKKENNVKKKKTATLCFPVNMFT